MKETDLADLIAKGKTKAYTFKSKAGKSFKARLLLDKQNHKTTFEFVDTPQKKTAAGKAKSSGNSWGNSKPSGGSSGWGKSTGWGKK